MSKVVQNRIIGDSSAPLTNSSPSNYICLWSAMYSWSDFHIIHTVVLSQNGIFAGRINFFFLLLVSMYDSIIDYIIEKENAL